MNISRFYLSRESKGGQALAVIEVDSPIADAVIEKLRAIEPVILVKQVRL